MLRFFFKPNYVCYRNNVLQHLSFSSNHSDLYFWRTYDQAEIDLIEEKNETFRLWEFKWNPRRKGRFSNSFTETYNVSSKQVINPKTLYKLIS